MVIAQRGVDGGWKPSLGGEAPRWRGLGRPPLVLGKAGPGPLLQRGEEVWAQGVCGSWGLWAARLARARVGVLGMRSWVRG